MRFIVVIFSFLLISCGSNVTTPKINEPKQTNKTKISENSNTLIRTEKTESLLISINGLSKGNKYDVDGPLWYDGTAHLEELNSNEMRISISMSVPPVGTPYQIKEGKVNVVIKLIKEKDGKYTLYLMDMNKSKMAIVPDVKLTIGKTEAGWFSASKEYAKITTSNQYYEFTVNDSNNIYISSNTMPGGLTLIKK